MISPSDSSRPDANAAPREAWDQKQQGNAVIPLEFKPVDHPLRHKVAWVDHSYPELKDQERRDQRLRDELQKLESRFQAQTEQVTDQLAESKREARQEARREWEMELEERVAKERQKIARLCAEFSEAQKAYFASVEAEVVRLALAIAKRVLHREAKLDPLLLSAVVRLALESVAEDSNVILHVPKKDVEAWQALLSEGLPMLVRVVGEEQMDAADCFLETSVGRVEMGVVAQLQEIEKGFFDLLQLRPA